jgi:nitroimidazol reductase NimA-like FMN-containing flavoprotein (pyridoxamine 5'-phosphate oxidase superfamily)
MLDPLDVDRILSENRYLVLATADDEGNPWATPVFFAPLDPDTLCWVSAPSSRHSRNIADRPRVAITVFDSTVEIGHAEAAYFDASAVVVPASERDAALRALNGRLPEGKRLEQGDLEPDGTLVLYRAALHRRYLLVPGGNTEFANTTDMTREA